MESLARSIKWLPEVLDACPRVLIAVQDGMAPDDLVPHIGVRVGLFVGGSTGWKLATLRQWGRLATDHGVWLHVGRVNTVRRVRRCLQAGATSFDGSSVSRYSANVHKLEAARRLGVLL
jgi:hypothetical protein